MAEYLDHFLAIQHFLDKAVHCAQISLLVNIVFPGTASQFTGNQQHNDSGNHRDDGQHRVEHQHGNQSSNHGDHRVDNLRNALADHLTKGIHVVGVHRHNVAMGVGIKILNGKRLHLVEEVVPKVAHRPLADVNHDAVIGKDSHHAYGQNANQTDNRLKQSTKILGTTVDHGDNIVIHQSLGKGRANDRRHCTDHNADQHQRKQPLVVVKHVADDPSQHAGCCCLG